jgi:hypothetical protein
MYAALGKMIRLVKSADEKVLIEGPVIVKVVASRGSAGIKREPTMTRAFFGDAFVATVAVVHGHGHSHGHCRVRTVLDVTGHAVPGIQPSNAISVSRIGKLLPRVRVLDL